MPGPILYKGPARAPFWPPRQELKGSINLLAPWVDNQPLVLNTKAQKGGVDGEAYNPIVRAWVENQELVFNTKSKKFDFDFQPLPSLERIIWVDDLVLSRSGVFHTKSQKGGVDGEAYNSIVRAWVENQELVFNTKSKKFDFDFQPLPSLERIIWVDDLVLSRSGVFHTKTKKFDFDFQPLPSLERIIWVDDLVLSRSGVFRTKSQKGGVDGEAYNSIVRAWVENQELVLNTKTKKFDFDFQPLPSLERIIWVDDLVLSRSGVFRTKSQRGGVDGEAFVSIGVKPFDFYYGYGRHGGKEINYQIAYELDIKPEDERFIFPPFDAQQMGEEVKEEKKIKSTKIKMKLNEKKLKKVLSKIEPYVTIISYSTLAYNLFKREKKK